MRCAGCGVGQGRRAPVHARASQNQLSSEKNTYDLEDVFFVFLPNGAQRLIFTMKYHLREDQVFTILTQKWSNSTSGQRGASGIQCGQNLTQSGSNLIPIGRNWDPMKPNQYLQNPDQPPKRTLCYVLYSNRDKMRSEWVAKGS